MQTILTDNYGTEWLTDECLVVGDYVGAGSVGTANLRWLEERKTTVEVYPSHFSLYNKKLEFRDFESVDFSIVIIRSDYGYKRALIRLTGDMKADSDVISATLNLITHACFDDELVSDIESEWEKGAWKAAVKNALVEYLPENLVEQIENIKFHRDTQAIDDFYFKAYREAMESTNTYPEPEFSCSHIDVDRIRIAFYKACMEVYR